jgi:hypothetical protein
VQSMVLVAVQGIYILQRHRIPDPIQIEITKRQPRTENFFIAYGKGCRLFFLAVESVV